MGNFTCYLRAPVSMLLIFTVLLGGIYPLLVTSFAQVLFHHRANGSLIERGDKVVGSSLLGQEFTSAKYFWGRLSATTPAYNASASTGSNFGAANPKLLEAANTRIAALQKSSPGNKSSIPMDLVTASASGLDPHISIKSAEYQVPRVAKARNMKEEDVRKILADYSNEALFGFFGEPRVNVLLLNMALDKK